jgi:hypothetical protein
VPRRFARRTMLRLPVRSELLADVIRFTLEDAAVRPA